MADMEFFNRRKAYATEQLSVNTTTTLTQTTYDNVTAGSTSAQETFFPGNFRASAALVEVIAEGIYYTFNGTNPASNNGHKLNVGDQLPVAGYEKVSKLKMVKNTTTATVQVTYFKE